MKKLTASLHCMTRGDYRVYFEGLEFSRGAKTAQTATLDSGIYTKSIGVKPVEITIMGHFYPTEMTFYSSFIRSFYKGEGRLVIDGWIIENPILIEGKAVIPQNGLLGEYNMKFGVLD